MTQHADPARLDPRRYFTPSEVTAAWLIQDRKCRACQREVPRDLAEGDHIIAWSRGGPTTMENLQVLCIACNRRKGVREGTAEEVMPPTVTAGTSPLRDWQERALLVALDTTGPVLIEACPGAGKTRFGLECAARLFSAGVINRVLIVVPTAHLVHQWVEAGAGDSGGPVVPLAPAGWRPTQPLLRRWAGAAFTYHALQAQAALFQALAAEPGFRTFVIFDEIHHAGAESAWGITAHQAFMASATRVLSLSGTAFRTKDPIAFSAAPDGRPVARDSYTYGEALADGVCRPLKFAAIGGTATFRAPGGAVETVSFNDDLTEQDESYRLRTVLDPGGEHLREMLDTADQELRRLRATSDPDAGGFVVCVDCDHADSVAQVLHQITGTRPIVACSRLNDPDDPAPRPALRAFAKGTAPWIVSVKMISEGVDIRRLRVLVYATNILTELAFRQITGRLVRTDPKNGQDDYGSVVLPADPRLLEMAERILDEVPAPQRESLIIRDPAPGETVTRGTRPDGGFVPLGSTGELSLVTDTSGRSAPAELVEAAKRYIASSGSPIAPFELALAAAHDDRLGSRLLSYLRRDDFTTTRKPQAMMACAWAVRNCRQAGPARRGAGSKPAARRISRTADAAVTCPSRASSPGSADGPRPGSPAPSGRSAP